MDQLAQLQQRLAGFFPDVLGVKLVSAAPDCVVAEIRVREDLCTVPGVMHGGAIMAFADTLGAVGTVMNLKDGQGTTTLESKTNFFAPGIAGTVVRAECRALHRGGRTMVWQTDVTGEDGRLIAKVTQTQMVLEPRRTPQEQLAALFEGKDASEIKALLAQLERGGAAIYRSLAEHESDPAERERLLQSERREIENAEVLERRG